MTQSTPPAITLLLAPSGQLSSDGQLLELMQERRSQLADRAALWFLPEERLQQFGLSDGGQEAVAAADPAVITWLQLRFGGRVLALPAGLLTPAQLGRLASELPPRAAAVTLA